MALMALYRDIKPVDQPVLVECTTRPLSEHLWTYFEFSYDKSFKDDSRLAIPDIGDYELKTGQNARYFEHWVSAHNIAGEDYERLYRIAGYITHVMAEPSTEPELNIPEERLASNYDASTNLFPATGGTGVAGAILKGDIFPITVAGTLGITKVSSGFFVRALENDPGQSSGKWDIITPAEELVPGQLYVRVTVGRV